MRRDIFFAYPVAMTSLAIACGSSTGGGDQADADASDHVAGDGSAPSMDAASSEAHANDGAGNDANDATGKGASDAAGNDAGDSGGNDASDAAGNDASDAASTTGGMPLPAPLYGVTVDDISALSDVVTALGALPHRPTTRIVFDQGEMPAYYAQAVPAVHAVSYVLGEILDSSAVAQVSVSQYAQRTSAYLAAFPTGVDVWEVGNEINGNWLGTASDVASKMTQAFDLVKAAGQHTELTLYGCSDSGATYDMFAWVNANVPARMLSGLDYVLVSYYEGDCGAPRSDWPSVFQQLRQLFPTAGLGFGEVGYVDANGNDLALQDESGAATYLQKYYAMQIGTPGYVGGYFWWYFAEDMVPDSRPLFAVLSAAIH